MEDLEFDNQDEGVKNLRAKAKAEEQRRKELEAELEAIHAERAEAEAKARAEATGSVFATAGLPGQLARFYPEDAPIDVESVRSWAEHEMGVKPQTAASTETVEQNDSVWNRYDRFVRGSFRSDVQDPFTELQDEAFKGVMDAVGEVVSEERIESKPYLPSDKEREHAAKVTKAINAQRAEYERRVNQGRAEPLKAEFGGRYDAPYYANRSRQLLDKMTKG